MNCKQSRRRPALGPGHRQAGRVSLAVLLHRYSRFSDLRTRATLTTETGAPCSHRRRCVRSSAMGGPMPPPSRGTSGSTARMRLATLHHVGQVHERPVVLEPRGREHVAPAPRCRHRRRRGAPGAGAPPRRAARRARPGASGPARDHPPQSRSAVRRRVRARARRRRTRWRRGCNRAGRGGSCDG
jgi:hypothetical protein